MSTSPPSKIKNCENEQGSARKAILLEEEKEFLSLMKQTTDDAKSFLPKSQKIVSEAFQDSKALWVRSDTNRRAMLPSVERALIALGGVKQCRDLLWFCELAEMMSSPVAEMNGILSGVERASTEPVPVSHFFLRELVLNQRTAIPRMTVPDLLLLLAVGSVGEKHLGIPPTTLDLIPKAFGGMPKMCYFMGRYGDIPVLHRVDPQGSHAREALTGACSSGDLYTVKYLWKAATADLDHEDAAVPKGRFRSAGNSGTWTPFVAACLSGNPLVVKFLIDNTSVKLAQFFGLYQVEIATNLARGRKLTKVLEVLQVHALTAPVKSK